MGLTWNLHLRCHRWFFRHRHARPRPQCRPAGNFRRTLPFARDGHQQCQVGIFTGHVDDLLIESNRTSGSIDEHGSMFQAAIVRNPRQHELRQSRQRNHMNGDLSQGGDELFRAIVSETGSTTMPFQSRPPQLGGGSGSTWTVCRTHSSKQPGLRQPC